MGTKLTLVDVRLLQILSTRQVQFDRMGDLAEQLVSLPRSGDPPDPPTRGHGPGPTRGQP